MATGKISRFFEDRGFGFIKQDAGGKDLFFHVSAVQGLAKHELAPGTRVHYETESSRRGPRARVVRPAGDRQKTAQDQSSVKYRFLNPYNFVRSLKAVAPNAEPLLGHCPPPPHDRYLGLSGRIKCKITAQTPLFISDSHAIETKTVVERRREKEHPSYRFFRYKNYTR